MGTRPRAGMNPASDTGSFLKFVGLPFDGGFETEIIQYDGPQFR